MAVDADALFRQIALLSERLAALAEEHDRLPWDAFDQRYRLKAEQRDLEEQVARLHRQAQEAGG